MNIRAQGCHRGVHDKPKLHYRDRSIRASAINQCQCVVHFMRQKPLKLLQKLRRQVKTYVLLLFLLAVPRQRQSLGETRHLWLCARMRFFISQQFHGRKTFATFPFRVAWTVAAAAAVNEKKKKKPQPIRRHTRKQKRNYSRFTAMKVINTLLILGD